MSDDEEMLVVNFVAEFGAEKSLRWQDFIQMQVLAIEQSMH